MEGIVYSVIAGIFITLQGVFNTRVSEKLGPWHTTAIVHALGLATAVIIFFITREKMTHKFGELNKLYLLGGIFGVLIVFSVMRGIGTLGPSMYVMIMLVSQLFFSFIIDLVGLFGTQKVPFNLTKPIGLAVIIVGIIIYKLKG